MKVSHDKNCSFPCPFGCGEVVNCSTVEKHCKEGKCKEYLLSCPACKPPLCCGWHGHGGAEYEEHVSKCHLAPFVAYAEYTQLAFAEIQKTISDHLKKSVVQNLNSENWVNIEGF